MLPLPFVTMSIYLPKYGVVNTYRFETLNFFGFCANMILYYSRRMPSSITSLFSIFLLSMITRRVGKVRFVGWALHQSNIGSWSDTFQIPRRCLRHRDLGLLWMAGIAAQRTSHFIVVSGGFRLDLNGTVNSCRRNSAIFLLKSWCTPLNLTLSPGIGCNHLPYYPAPNAMSLSSIEVLHSIHATREGTSQNAIICPPPIIL